jgi:hypothetical protein
MAYSLPDKIRAILVKHGVPEAVEVGSWQVTIAGKSWKLPLVVNEPNLKALAEEILKDG